MDSFRRKCYSQTSEIKRKRQFIIPSKANFFFFLMKKTFREVNVFSNDTVCMCDDLVLILPWVDYGKVFYHTIKMKLRKYVYFVRFKSLDSVWHQSVYVEHQIILQRYYFHGYSCFFPKDKQSLTLIHFHILVLYVTLLHMYTYLFVEWL